MITLELKKFPGIAGWRYWITVEPQRVVGKPWCYSAKAFATNGEKQFTVETQLHATEAAAKASCITALDFNIRFSGKAI